MSTLGPKVVTIGGGTGTFTVLQALRRFLVSITAIVSMADDGGSSGRLRDELGILPPGDARQALVGLSRDSDMMRDMFNFRFEDGHNFGNLFMAVLAKLRGSMAEAIAEASRVLNISGRVMPVSYTDTRLCLDLPNGETVIGEDTIGEKCAGQNFFRKGEAPDLYLNPPAVLNPEAYRAIMEADLVVICPGKLYSSVVPNLLVDGMVEALIATKAKIVYVCNLMTQVGQTDGFCVADFVDALHEMAGAPFIDEVIFNNRPPSAALLAKYAKEGEEVIAINQAVLDQRPYKAKGLPLISEEPYVQSGTDRLPRTLIRHMLSALGSAIMGTIDAS